MSKNVIYRVGLDVGSTTAKAVFMDPSDRVVYSDYRRHHTEIVKIIQHFFKAAESKLGDGYVQVHITGSAGMGISEKTGFPFIQEVVATADYVRFKYPEVRTLIDLGGEDSKMIFFGENRYPDIRMNGSCAGGTGAFIDQMATLLHVPVEELNRVSEEFDKIYPIASRCGVFAKTDIQNLISRKISKADIAASIFHAVAVQAVNTLARGVDMLPKVLFCGGPCTFIPKLREAFIRNMKIKPEDTILPERAELLPATGAALHPENEKKYRLSELSTLLEEGTAKKQKIHDRLPPLFPDRKTYEDWEQGRSILRTEKVNWESEKELDCFLGIDSGSTTTKIIVLDSTGRLVYDFYANNNGNSLDTLVRGLAALQEKMEKSGNRYHILQTAVTGYGEDLIKAALGIDYGIVETIAHFTAARNMDPEVSFVLDIGGQDMKAIYIQNGNIQNLEINEACSSGCGSFIEGFANSLNHSVSDFAQKACAAEAPCELGTRCTVFMNSKVKQSLREGAGIEDISAGLSYSVIKNCLFKVLKIKDMNVLGDHIVVQGGTLRNPSIVRALEQLTGKKVTCSDIPELMGAFGAALYARNQYGKNKNGSSFTGLSSLETVNEYTTRQINCKGCENNCTITKFYFENKNEFFSGNKCEKIFSNKGAVLRKGENLYDYKLESIFKPFPARTEKPVARLGIPLVLNMYENYPFWSALLAGCGIEVVRSATSTMSLYEKGMGTVMSDNICFPAKLVHGHVMDLVEKKVDRIFYPLVIFEGKEQADAANSFNCPIVSSYSDVIKSSMNTAGKYDVPVDAPTVVFNDQTLLRKACYNYLKQFGVRKAPFQKAFAAALDFQEAYKADVRVRIHRVIENARKDNRLVILLAGRPYHMDPQVHQKTSQVLAALGVDVITEDAAAVDMEQTFSELATLPQWTYPNRIFKAAQWAGKQGADVQFAQLTSFGCGPDAFIIDEVNRILKAAGKNHTLIKIDEITSIGSVRLRLRSMIESLRLQKAAGRISREDVSVKTPLFEEKDRDKTILIPYFSEVYAKFLPSMFKAMGYKFENLPAPDKQSVEYGLQYANNEICYPATIVVGDIVKALKSGKYNLSEVAIGITQTGGQCRASNYLSLIKKAVVAAGFRNVPVISVSPMTGMLNNQPGFKLKWKRALGAVFVSTIYMDAISRLYYAAAVREKQKGEAARLMDHHIQKMLPHLENREMNRIYSRLEEAVEDFNRIDMVDRKFPRVGLVGEIYVKYNGFANHNVVQWLIDHGAEVAVPPLIDFFTQHFVNIPTNRKLNLKRKTWIQGLNKLLEAGAGLYMNRAERILSNFRHYTPGHKIWDLAEGAERICSLANQFGEGWLIPAEISSFAKEGIHNVVSVQPFGCIANHVISKGVEKRIKDLYPDMNLLFLDFDAGTSNVNVHNRLYFMLKNAKEQLKATEAAELAHHQINQQSISG